MKSRYLDKIILVLLIFMAFAFLIMTTFDLYFSNPEYRNYIKEYRKQKFTKEELNYKKTFINELKTYNNLIEINFLHKKLKVTKNISNKENKINKIRNEIEKAKDYKYIKNQDYIFYLKQITYEALQIRRSY